MSRNLNHKLGQNTAEYLIMLTLIAVGSIGLVTAFGQQIRNKITMVTSAFQGEDQSYEDAQGRSGKNTERSKTLSESSFGIKGTAADNDEFKDEVQK